MKDFVHLNVHSQYSLLDGAIKLPDLMARLKEYGMGAVALTDSGNMFGAIDFYKRAKAAGIKPIIGMEAFVAPGSRKEQVRGASSVVLLAKDAQGYANLGYLASMGYREGFYYRPRIDLELLRARSAGLIALSGSGRGQIGRAIREDQPERARELAALYRDIFEPGCFYLEVRPIDLAEQRKVNAASRELGHALGIPLVATNACHYLDRKMARAHEVLLCVQQGRTLDDPRRIKQETDGYWLKPADVMWQEMGADFADALENTVRIAEQCTLSLTLGVSFLPTYHVPEGFDTDSYLDHCAREGLDKRFAEFEAVGKEVDREAYRARLEEELGIIKSMKFPGYFLIVQDFINWAKDHDISVGPGRGSGAGSLAAYALRITDIDPIPYGLLFERFLNPERVSMPDFDIDFCMNRRGEVIKYVTEKYGEQNVGQIATFGSLKAKGVIKDVGRVLGLSFAETDRLSKLVPDVLNITLKQAIEQEPKLKQLYDDDPRIHDLLDIALSLEGLHRQAGMHAAGVVIGDKPLWEYCPVFNGANDELVTQYAKDEVELIGLVKFDFLGLKTLTVIDDAVRMVNRTRPDDPLDMAKLTLDDPDVFALIGRGDTEGVFQLESSGFQELLKKLKPDKFEDIVAAVALYRPGPLNSGMLDDFIARKHGRQKISYPHPSLKAILEETYGVIVYQEQVMQIAQVLAGFTLGGADLLRRAMGKKKADVMAAQRAEFCKGAKAREVDEARAGEIFDLMEKFAEYGFNKSHSAAYALLTYQTAYLKVHHKVEFMAALVTNDRDNADKVAKGIRNARKIGVEVLPPDVNRSQAYFDAVEGRILFGMAGMKGVGETAVDAILEARGKDGPFTSLVDFCKRVDLRRVNKKTIEALIKAGAFDFCGEPRARLCAAVDAAVERAQQAQRDAASGQASFFDMLAAPGVSDDDLPASVREVEEWPDQVLLANEKACLGFYVSGHPLDRFAEQIERFATATVESLPRCQNYDKVTLAGVQTSLKIRPFKSGDGRMAIILFEDHTGAVEVIAMGDEFDRYEALLTSDEPLLLTGTVRAERDEDRTNISVRLGEGRRRRGADEPPPDDAPLVLSLAEVRATRSKGLEVELRTAACDKDKLGRLRKVLTDERHRGTCQAWLKLITDDDCEVRLRLPDVVVAPSDDLSHEVRRLFGDQCAVHVH